ncbi:NACHT domain-containing protein [Actinomadura sp. SCN-SB]|uniref:NACHT domain-containing protein n=1 Tax=Actinomadura sp. SCN-SB TaxID=3373092 RepID=UPI003751C47E
MTLLLLTVFIGLVTNLATGTVEVDGRWVLVTWAVLGVLVVATVIVQLRQGGARSTSDRQAQAEETLARAVRRRWDDEAAARALDQPVPMPVQWKLHELSTADHVPEGFPGTSDPMEDFARFFRYLDRRRLVVLGGAGAGKTTLAVQLLRALLRQARRENGARDSVPVLLQVSDWRPGAAGSFLDWLVKNIDQEYPFLAREYGPGIVRLLVEDNRILPILDGLDELPAAKDLIQALRNSLTEDSQFILTCRTEPFREAAGAGERPSGMVVIEPEPLAAAAIADYLRRCLSLMSSTETQDARWEAILVGLESPEPPSGSLAILGSVVSTPLGLWLLRATYVSSDGDPRELLDSQRFPDEAALRRHLFDQLIPAVARTAQRPSDEPAPRRPRRDYEPDRLRERLRVVASLMESMPSAAYYSVRRDSDGAPTRDFRWWYLAAAVVPRWLLPLVHVGLGAVIGATTGALAGVFATEETAQGLGDNAPAPVTAAIGFAFLGSLVGGWQARSAWDAARRTPVLTVIPFRWSALRLAGQHSRLLRIFAAIFAALLGIILAIRILTVIVGKVWEEIAPPAPEWFSSSSGKSQLLPVLIVAGLALLLTLAFIEDDRQHEVAGPVSTLRAEFAGVLLKLAAGGFVAGLFLLFRAISEPGYGRVGLDGAVFAFVLLCIGLLAGSRVWLGYLTAVVVLAVRDGFPLRLIAFMDDAHRMGLLRTFGPAYQFRHADLQDHLAMPYRVQGAEGESAESAESPAQSGSGLSRILRRPFVLLPFVLVISLLVGMALRWGLEAVLSDAIARYIEIVVGMLAIAVASLWNPIRRCLRRLR